MGSFSLHSTVSSMPLKNWASSKIHFLFLFLKERSLLRTDPNTFSDFIICENKQESLTWGEEDVHVSICIYVCV